ncbi:MAG: triose-phosphate isomerase [Candidatus Bruticola sp.]
MRVPLLAANWKMNMARTEAHNMVTELLAQVGDVKDRDIAICPPFHLLADVEKLVEGYDNVYLGAQDLYWKDFGAYTGEVSAPMLLDVGCRMVIIGHSERRAMFGETDESCSAKVAAAVAHKLIPILCVGESLAQREENKTAEVVTSQLRGALQGLEIEDGSQLVIAYEPIWAIGTGKTDTPESANETMVLLRKTLEEIFNKEIADKVRLLYGGSVKPANIVGFMACSDIDGALVGGASLKADSFTQIVRY